MTATGSRLRRLECRACCTEVEADRLVGTCPTCGHTLFADYDLDGLEGRAWWAGLSHRPWTLWRYAELLPVRTTEGIVTLGEGGTAVLDLGEVPEASSVELSLKDDGSMATGSFKARGMAVAVSRARELGAQALFAPSAGNAGIALAAYAARAGLPARIYLPEFGTGAVQELCRRYGAEVVTTAGTIRDAGEAGRAAEKGRGSFEMSTLREPYRLEGKKTMGFEILEQLGEARVPEAILYPTGGGTGLVGMHKAFEELRTLGLTEARPRFYAIQPEGCAPVVRALREGAARVTPWEAPSTIAPGLLVPSPFASERILEAVRTSRGGGETVSDLEVVEAVERLARRHGISASPEAAAAYAALGRLCQKGEIHPGERVLLYNTGAGGTTTPARLRAEIGARP